MNLLLEKKFMKKMLVFVNSEWRRVLPSNQRHLHRPVYVLLVPILVRLIFFLEIFQNSNECCSPEAKEPMNQFYAILLVASIIAVKSRLHKPSFCGINCLALLALITQQNVRIIIYYFKLKQVFVFYLMFPLSLFCFKQ